MNIQKKFAVSILFFVIVFLLLQHFDLLNISFPNLKNYTGWVPGLIALAALIDSVNPCAFSILFLSATFLFSLGKTKKQILMSGSLYILGIFLVYVLIGLGLLKVLMLFNVPHLMSKIGSVFLISFGLIAFINEYFPNFPIKLVIPKFAKGSLSKVIEKATLPASLLLGILVGLFEFPCTGGPYLFVLGLLHDQANYLKGFAYLIFYNFIFILPLIIVLLISSSKKSLEKADKIRRAETREARIWLALIMILLGTFIFMIQ